MLTAMLSAYKSSLSVFPVDDWSPFSSANCLDKFDLGAESMSLCCMV